MSVNIRRPHGLRAHEELLSFARRTALAIGVAAFLSPSVHAQTAQDNAAAPAAAADTAAPSQDANTQAQSPAPSADRPVAKSGRQAENLQTVVVVGQRAALKKAAERKKDSDKVSDSLVADDIGKLPDNSVTEALQRVPGVSISHFPAGGDADHFTAEGASPLIRGMNQVQSTLNGRETFSANGGRTLSFEDVTPELISGVDVYKSQSADLIEGGVGGTVDLRTHLPFDFTHPTAALTAKYNYADLADKWRPEASFLGAQNWKTNIGKIGALVDFAYSDLYTGTNTIGVDPYFRQTGLNPSDPTATYYVPGGVSFRNHTFDRKRSGIYGALQWKPDSDFDAYLTYFRSRYSTDQIAYQTYLSNGNSVIPSPASPAAFNGSRAMTYTGALVGKPCSDGFIWGPPYYTAADNGYACNEPAGTYDPINLSTDTGTSRGATVTADYSTGFKWDLTDDLRLKSDLQLVRSGADSANMDVFTWAYAPSVGLDLRGALPQISFPEGFNAEDPVQAGCNWGGYNGYGCGTGWQATMDHIEHHRGQEAAWRSDLIYQLSDDGFLRSLESGIRLARRTEIDDVSTYNYQALGANYYRVFQPPACYPDSNGNCNGQPPPEPNPPAPYHPFYLSYLSDTLTPHPGYQTLYDFGNFFGGAVKLPGRFWMPSESLVRDYPNNVTYLHQQLGAPGDSTKPVGYRPYDLSSIIEKTYSYYLLGRFAESDMLGVPVDGNLGVRLVYTTDDISGALALPSQTVTIPGQGAITFGGGSLPRSAHKTRFDALPSLNVRFQLRSDTYLRFALARALNRPSFGQLSPAANVSAQSDSNQNLTGFTGSSSGNPNLNPETANQADLSLEWYGQGGSEAHLAVFYKDLHNYIGTRSVTEQLPVQFPDGSIQMENVLVTEPFNEGQARIHGLEVGAQKFATFLPAPFDGLGLNTNFTLLYSQQPQAISTDMDGKPISGLPLEGLSKYTFNVIGMYEKGPWSARMAYNWRSKYLINIGNNGLVGQYTDNGNQYSYSLPTFNRAYGQLDGYLGYTFMDRHVTVAAEAQNITDAMTRTVVGFGDQQHPHNYFLSDRRYVLSLRLSY